MVHAGIDAPPQVASAQPRSLISALEFYSGIGGMRFALESSLGDSFDVNILSAFDINPHANQVYLHNFGHGVTSANLDNTMFAEKLSRYNADIYLMSPPCQPYTRTGNQNQADDPRSKSFLAFLDALPKLDSMNKAPKYFFIENVQGFETSNTRDLLVQVARSANYRFQEFLINPMHLGIPNSRTRYYFMAKHSSLGPFRDQELESYLLRSDIPEDPRWVNFCSNELGLSLKSPSSLNDFFGSSMLNIEKYRVPRKIFDKHAMVFDIVKPQSNHTCCFTKGYSTYAQATGSILNFGSQPDGVNWEDHRYFTEYEIAQLMGFPVSGSFHHTFTFPEATSLRQRYKLLGNSLNVLVVSKLLTYLLSP